MNVSNFAKNKLVDFILRGQSFVPPGSYYFALFVTNPADDGSGTEVVGGSYARVQVICSLANWSGTQGVATTTTSTGTGGVTSNNVNIAYPAPSANWGTIVGWYAYDALTGGNPYFWGLLDDPKEVKSGDQAPVINANKLIWTFGS